MPDPVAKCKAKAKARGTRGARAKALAKEKAQALAKASNERRQKRREVLQELNALSAEVGAERLTLQVKTKNHEVCIKNEAPRANDQEPSTKHQ